MLERRRLFSTRGPRAYAVISADGKRYMTNSGTFAPLPPPVTGDDLGHEGVLPDDARLGDHREMEVARVFCDEDGATLCPVDVGDE